MVDPACLLAVDGLGDGGKGGTNGAAADGGNVRLDGRSKIGYCYSRMYKNKDSSPEQTRLL